MQVVRSTQRDPEAGVTLVEILVVLSIIAITTGAAMLRLGFGRSTDDFDSAVARMASAVTAASDFAMQTGQDRLLELGPLGYRAVPDGSATEVSWQTIPGFHFSPVPGRNTALRLLADGASPPFDLRLAGSSIPCFCVSMG